ncbi:MAG: CcmD family protein [Filimonas sp.]|nr:CcmD family protein [Filimonas sp.]
MDKLKRIGLLIVFCMFSMLTFAQQMDTAHEDPTDFMRSNGKIYVVVVCAAVIVAGLFIYLTNLDRKISKLEKQTKKG